MPDLSSTLGAISQQPQAPVPLTIASPAVTFASAPELPLGTYLFQFFLLMTIAVVLGVFVLRYAREKWPALALATGSGKNLRVVERVVLDPQRQAYVLAVGQRHWLLVASGDQVTTVAELNGQDVTPDFDASVEKESKHSETV